MVYGRQHPHKSTVKDVLKDLKEKNINFTQVVEYRTYHCHNGEYLKEGVPLRDTGVRNGKQSPVILNILNN